MLSSDILPERESQADATVTENYLLQTEGHQTDMFPGDNEHVDIATSADNLVEDITNENQATMEELTTNKEISNADNQAEIHLLKQKLEDCNQKLQLQLQEIKALQVRPTVTKEQLQENNDMVTYYTGLPNFETLTLVFELA